MSDKVLVSICAKFQLPDARDTRDRRGGIYAPPRRVPLFLTPGRDRVKQQHTHNNMRNAYATMVDTPPGIHVIIW